MRKRKLKPVHPGEIHHDGALDRLRSTGQARRTAADHHRRTRFLGPPEDHADLLRGLGEGKGDSGGDAVSAPLP